MSWQIDGTTGWNAPTSESRVRYNVAPLPDPPRIERRKSRVHGWGVFALQAIPKNKRIIDYAGERITSKESTPREEAYLAKGHIWCFKLNNRWVIDAAVERQHRALHQPRLQAELLLEHRQWRDLDPRGAVDSQG